MQFFRPRKLKETHAINKILGNRLSPRS